MLRKSVLIITSDFLPTPSANGVCAYNLARVLMERGYSVNVISSRKPNQDKIELIDGINIHRINNHYYTQFIKSKKLQTLLLRLNLFLHIFMYPLTSVIAVIKYAQLTNKIIKNHGINLVITINNPLIGCLSGVFLKKKFKEKLKLVLYDVDSFSNTVEGRFITQRKKIEKMWKWEKLILNTADLAIIMRNHESYYHQDKYSSFHSKIRITNFPMMYTRDERKQKNRVGMIECIYLGTLSQLYRNPTKVCEVFSVIPNVTLKFFGKIDNTDRIIHSFSESSEKRIQHLGMVTFDQGQKILQEADVLISIGNRESDMVPSKTYEYMSYCKPIIHFYSSENDPVITILSQYPLALLLDINEPLDRLTERIKGFFDTAYGKRVDSKIIRQLFIESTPEYSIDLIEDYFNKDLHEVL